MLNLDDDKLEELAETLYDLKHDLGKYIKLPLAMLPKDASSTQVADAILRGINETRKGPRGIISAEMLLAQFDDEWGTTLSGVAAYDAIKAALERAVAWAPKVVASNAASLDRGAVSADLAAVSDAIQTLLSEVEGG